MPTPGAGFDFSGLPRTAPSVADGLLTPGTIDLHRRPVVRNPDGSVSTVRSISIGVDGREVLIPTISDDGRALSNDEAIATFKRTGKHLGMFDTPAHATAYAQRLHQEQAQEYTPTAAGTGFDFGDLPKADRRSSFAKVVDRATTPLVPQLATGGRAAAAAIDPTGSAGGLRLEDLAPEPWARALPLAPPKLLTDVARNLVQAPVATVKGLGAGLVQGAGDVAAQFTSPMDLILTLAGLKSVSQAGHGVGVVARGVNAVGSAALAGRGAEAALKADSPSEALSGAAQAAIGLAGVAAARPPAARVVPPTRIRGALTGEVRPSFLVSPEGVAGVPEAMPMHQAADGSFVRAVPGEYPRREPVALLPDRAAAANELVAVPGGQVARRGDVVPGRSLLEGFDFEGLPTAAPATKGRAQATPVTVPAAVQGREFDGARVTRKVFSGDPSATDAPLVDLQPRERLELQRILQEMQAGEFTPHTFNPVEVGRGGAYDIVPGAAGAPVHHDILQGRSGVSRADVQGAIAGMLEGQHSATGQRALDVARRRLEGDPSLSRPMLPPEAGVRNPPLKGDGGEDDFQGFGAMLDDLAALGPIDEPGQRGAINPMLLQHLGGGAAGAVIGGTTGDDPESRIRGAVLGGLAGAIAPSVLRVAGGVLRGRVLAPAGAGAVGEAIPTTLRTPRAPETPMRDATAGVDTFLGKFPGEIREGIKSVIEENGGFQAQRRGSMPQAQVEQLAAGITADVQRRVTPGTALNAEGIRAHVDALAGAQSRLNELAGRIARGPHTDDDLLALQAAKAQVSTLTASVMGARSEAGRALAQWRAVARVMASGDRQLIGEAANGLRGDAAQFARDFSQVGGSELDRFRWLQEQDRPGIRERVRQYYTANILSGLKTHERNTIGNAANALSNLAVQPVSAGIDALRSAATGRPREVLFSELPSRVAGTFLGVERGISEAMYSLRNGVNRSALSDSLRAGQAGKLDVPRIEFAGGGANPINWPGRALDAADQFFRSIAWNQEASGLAHVQAKREGLSGQALVDRMAALRAGEGQAGQRIQAEADVYARRAVFQEQPGPIIGHLQALSRERPEIAFVMPFVKTPGNILRQGFEFSPAGFGMSAARAAGRPGTDALARATLGSVAASGLAWLAATGRLSGNGPADPSARAQLMESGWRPNSVRIGDHWVGIALFQPISVQAMAIANGFDAWKAEGMKEADAPTKAAAALQGFSRSVLDLSFLSGVADLLETVDGGTLESGARMAGRVAHGLTPFSGAQRTITSALDPTVRQPRGFLEALEAGVPGLSTAVPSKLDRFGNEVTRPGGPVRRAADPMNVASVSDDPVLGELGRLGVRMGMPGGHVGGVELSRDQGRALQQLKGSQTYVALATVVASPAYGRLDAAQQAALLEKVIDRTRGTVQGAVRARLKVAQEGR